MKKLLALTLALSTFTASALAEQPKAAEYKQIMSSGNYYVEYELNAVKKCLAVKDGKRMDYTIYTSMGNPFLSAIPIIGLASFTPAGKLKYSLAGAGENSFTLIMQRLACNCPLSS